MAKFGAETFRTMLEPFSLEELYPEVEVELPNGKFKRTHTIQPHQMLFHNRKSLNGKEAKFVCLSGGVGSGKSICASVEMVRLARMYPGIKIVCVTGYDYYCTEFILPTFRKVLPDESPHIKRIYIKNRTYLMQNGSTIRFAAYDDPEKIKGWDCHVIWIEEPSEIGDGNNDKARSIFTALMERLRCMTPAYPLRVYFTMNPRGHNWAWSLFVKNEPGIAPQPLGDAGKETVFGRTSEGDPKWYCEWEKVNQRGDIFYTIATGSIANQFIPTGYVATMLGANASNPAHLARMVEGRFTPMNMLIYDAPIYSERTHVIKWQTFLDYWEIDDIPPWWRVIVGIDCGGTRSPWAVEFYAQTDAGHWVCFDEIYALQQEGMMWAEVAELILDKSVRNGLKFENIEYWIDPISSQQKSGPTSQTIQEEFSKRGLHVKTPKGYNKHGGILRVQSLLKPDRSQPCPYIEDYVVEEGSAKEVQEEYGKYSIGLSQIYYLSNILSIKNDRNINGHACAANLAEKSVYRYDSTKIRNPKESEEGLSPAVSEKVIDRDDHAQTAEMFCFLGIKPAEARGKHGRPSRAPVDTAPTMYGRGAKHRSIG